MNCMYTTLHYNVHVQYCTIQYDLHSTIYVPRLQVLSASVTHIQAVYGVSSFVFYLADSDFKYVVSLI